MNASSTAARTVREATELFQAAFTEWERRYRENPREFANEVERLLGYTPATYGEAAAAYFEHLLNELAERPSEQIEAKS